MSNEWIQTYTGKQFYLDYPELESIDIVDIAHALSMVCRFNGHCLEFYSVAQHCVLVSQVCPPENALWGLLHDASEAYICDIPRPLKSMDIMKPYKVKEKEIQSLICQFYGLDAVEPASVKQADMVLLATEKRDLMVQREWAALPDPMIEVIKPLSPKDAENLFLCRYAELRK